MVKSYLKYEFIKAFGTVASSTSNLVWAAKDRAGTGAGKAVVAANEEVLCWDIKKGELLSQWRDENCSAQVTAICQSQTDKDVFAVGYADGSIRLWDSTIATQIVSFNGHRSAITCLAFDRSGVRLASGSKDTDIIIWDIVAEVGQYKLRGHKDQVTGLRFVEPQQDTSEEDGEQAMALDSEIGEGWLVTTGKDSLIKLWDLSTRYCVETHVAQTNEECWSLGVSPDFRTCITAGNGGELKVWSLNITSLLESRQKVELPTSVRYLDVVGTFLRHNKDKATEIIFHPKREYFVVHGTEKSAEIWRKRSEAEIKKTLSRKRRRRQKKGKDDGDVEMEDAVTDGADGADVDKADITDVYHMHSMVRVGGKVKSVDWAADHAHKDLQLLVGTTNNQLELYAVPLRKEGKAKDDTVDYTKSLSIELPGHRTDIRAVALSSDDKMLASASNGSLKVWNIKTQSCIRTFECGYALCLSFLPGDKIIVVGTKKGELELFDVASASLLDAVPAHEGAVWGLQVHPDGRSLVSGSADKTAKFWNFKIIQEPVLGTSRTTPRLRLVEARVLKVADDILTVKFSPDGKLLACALLSSSVKVFFVDTLKLYLNIYGHSLPVISMDISHDSKLLVTSSADKTIKIWGLDFGDLHKSLLKHSDSILQVAFVPRGDEGSGHHFFSASKDRSLRYWDGDKFQHIQRLDGHHGEIWAMAIAKDGAFVVTASHDKSIRVWQETDDQLFLEEEQEKELEELYEATLTKSLEQDANDLSPENGDGEGDAGGIDDVAAASKQTISTLTAGERIQEALTLCLADLALLQDHQAAQAQSPTPLAPPQRNIIFLATNNISAPSYLLKTLSSIPPATLNDALRTLPFSTIPALFTFLQVFARRGMNVPLTCRILFFILKLHQREIVGARAVREGLEGIREALRGRLEGMRDEVGFNCAALRVIGARFEGRVVGFVGDEPEEEEEGGGGEDGPQGRGDRVKRGFVQIS